MAGRPATPLDRSGIGVTLECDRGSHPIPHRSREARSLMTRRFTLPAALALLAVAGAPASAIGRTETNPTTNPAGHIRGVVHARSQASRFRGGTNNLTYHNGAVMHANQVYAVYWDPAGS